MPASFGPREANKCRGGERYRAGAEVGYGCFWQPDAFIKMRILLNRKVTTPSSKSLHAAKDPCGVSSWNHPREGRGGVESLLDLDPTRPARNTEYRPPEATDSAATPWRERSR